MLALAFLAVTHTHLDDQPDPEQAPPAIDATPDQGKNQLLRERPS
jgi:hypothetical protein